MTITVKELDKPDTFFDDARTRETIIEGKDQTLRWLNVQIDEYDATTEPPSLVGRIKENKGKAMVPKGTNLLLKSGGRYKEEQ
ncbi:hypothetical protein PGQ11_007963 [Apiospora arundinis]|jgi:hypothetical protein|uniref:Uncharacterized protein n=1 Tax=Apiospora arundinis TaxID=335852 RepID=A0ABR2IXV7_9PEZI